MLVEPLFAQVADHWLEAALAWLSHLAPAGSFFANVFNLRALLALVLVSVSCGAVGALVVGGRMAFFSDALAHCSFASVSIGFVLFTTVILRVNPTADFWDYVTLIMLGLGMATGFGIAYARERTGLASDTIIGVFFAAAIGLAATLATVMKNRALFKLEDFLFGNPYYVTAPDLVHLALLAVVTVGLIGLTYNSLLLAGFNSSLALSRRVPMRLVSYLFIVLLALVVNLCVRTVGVMLINALLVVPAATAANVSRNMRQVFWLTMLLCLGACLVGQGVAWEVDNRFGFELGTPGTIVLVSVFGFIVSAVVGPLLRERKPATA